MDTRLLDSLLEKPPSRVPLVPEPSVKEPRSGWKAIPVVAGLPGLGPIAAGYFSQKSLFFEADKIEILGATTLGPQAALRIEYSSKDFLGTALKLKAWAGYDNFDISYFGRGNRTLRSDRERLRPGKTELGFLLTQPLGEHLSLGAGFVQRSWDLELLEAGTSIPDRDREGGTNRLLRLELARDTRDDKVDPGRGGYDLLRLEASSPFLGSEFDFSRMELRLARYRPLLPRQVLALRAEFATVLMGDAPFFELPRLGGRERLRGESGGRYRADSFVLFGAEWRLRLSGPLSLAVFGETGKVWDRTERLDLSGFHATGGIGMRYRISDACVLRFDLGLGSGGFKPLADFSHAF